MLFALLLIVYFVPHQSIEIDYLNIPFVTDAKDLTEFLVKIRDTYRGKADIFHVVHVWIQAFGSHLFKIIGTETVIFRKQLFVKRVLIGTLKTCQRSRANTGMKGSVVLSNIIFQHLIKLIKGMDLSGVDGVDPRGFHTEPLSLGFSFACAISYFCVCLVHNVST